MEANKIHGLSACMLLETVINPLITVNREIFVYENINFHRLFIFMC